MNFETVVKCKLFRNFDIELYEDCTTYHTSKGVPCFCYELLQRLTSDEFLDMYEYAYILHDKDIKEDGTPKKPHYHLFIRFHKGKTINSLHNKYGIPLNGFGLYPLTDKHGNVIKADDGTPKGYTEPVRKLRLEYLIHGALKDRDKYQYEPSEVVTNIANYSFVQEEDLNEAVDKMVEYCVSHSYREGYEYAKAHDLRKEFKANYVHVQRLKDEERVYNDSVRLASARAFRETYEDTYRRAIKELDKRAQEYAETAFIKAVNQVKPTQGAFIYDMKGNVIGVTSSNY